LKLLEILNNIFSSDILYSDMKKYNVILLLIDGARIDRLFQFPIFKKLKEEGCFFSEMITSAPYTLVAMNSIFTGMYGSKNGIDAYHKMFQDPKTGCKTLAEYLTENGWYTRGDAMRLSLVSNKGFTKLTSQEDDPDPDFSKIHKEILDETINEVNGERPYFLYLHYPKIHHSIKESVFDKYDDFSEGYYEDKKRNLRNYDEYLKEAADYLDEIYFNNLSKKQSNDSIIIIMTDHGMGVGEKVGERAYGSFTYDYTLRTFALFIQPKIFPKGKEISELVRAIDVMPTILDCLQVSTDQSCLRMQGQSLLNLINQTTDQNKSKTDEDSEFQKIAYSETGGVNGPWPSPNAPNIKCVRTKKWKLIHNLTPDTWELYNLKNDPQELKNVVDEYPLVVTKLKDKLQSIIDECTSG
jgi:arylsulfatase A-like enzyme